MKRLAALFITCVLILTVAVSGCNQSDAEEVTFDQLFSNLQGYKNKDVTLEAFYFHGFEIIVLSERLEYSGFAEGHLAPKGRVIWVSGGIPQEVYDNLDRQQMMGPEERYGRLRITGKFESGGTYGHLGGYAQQIKPSETSILTWVPPAPETPEGEGFAVYLLDPDVPVSQMAVVSHIKIADEPIISPNDIVSYNRETHEIELDANSVEKLSGLQVPVNGRSFAVCVDRYPVYWGAFWTSISSFSFDGVTIMVPLNTQDSKIIKIELGYPSPSFYQGEDPRNNEEVIRALEKAGKLVTGPSQVEAEQLPRSFKGYELYSWSEGGEWRFTLITGTNRNKTLEEIVTGPNTVSETGWVNIRVTGVEAVKALLSRLPENEHVFWMAELHEEPASQAGVNIILPPESTVNIIKQHAANCGLDFTVPTR